MNLRQLKDSLTSGNKKIVAKTLTLDLNQISTLDAIKVLNLLVSKPYDVNLITTLRVVPRVKKDGSVAIFNTDLIKVILAAFCSKECKLTHLDLAGNILTDEQMALFARPSFSQLNHLQNLKLSTDFLQQVGEKKGFDSLGEFSSTGASFYEKIGYRKTITRLSGSGLSTRN